VQKRLVFIQLLWSNIILFLTNALSFVRTVTKKKFKGLCVWHLFMLLWLIGRMQIFGWFVCMKLFYWFLVSVLCDLILFGHVTWVRLGGWLVAYNMRNVDSWNYEFPYFPLVFLKWTCGDIASSSPRIPEKKSFKHGTWMILMKTSGCLITGSPRNLCLWTNLLVGFV
jgi:hypothetical protein